MAGLRVASDTCAARVSSFRHTPLGNLLSALPIFIRLSPSKNLSSSWRGSHLRLGGGHAAPPVGRCISASQPFLLPFPSLSLLLSPSLSVSFSPPPCLASFPALSQSLPPPPPPSSPSRSLSRDLLSGLVTCRTVRVANVSSSLFRFLANPLFLHTPHPAHRYTLSSTLTLTLQRPSLPPTPAPFPARI